MLRQEHVYEALFDDDAFNAIVDLLPSSHGARSVLINFFHDSGDAFNLAHRHFSDAFMQDYVANFINEDPWLLVAMRPDRFNTTFNLSEALTCKQFENSRIYNDLVRRHGDDTYHSAGGTFGCGWGFGAVSIQRGKGALPFTDQEIAALNADVVAISRLLTVKGEIAAHRQQGDIARSALDIVGVPAITVRRDLGIAHANLAAEDVLRQGSGLSAKGGHLRARTPHDAGRLASAVAKATARFEPQASSLTIRRFSGPEKRPLPPYQVTVTPIVGRPGPAQALIVFRDPDAKDPSLVHRVRAYYQLTPAEAELAVALGSGLSVARIAEMRGVRESTLRSQVKSVAAKMDCKRQSEIAVIVAGIPQLREM